MAKYKTIVQTLDDVRDWFDTEVCQHVTFKQPSNEYMDEDYTYAVIHPQAFSMVTPTADMNGDKSPYPSVTIRLNDAKNSSNDDLAHGTRTMSVTALFAAWDPGLHGEDVYLPVGDGTYKRQSGPAFTETAQGWKDAWNFVDYAIQRIESVDYIGECLVDKKQGIDFSALEEAYPFWFAQLSFSLTIPIVQSHVELQDYL